MSKEYLEALKNIKLGIRSGIFYSLNDRERFINDDNFKIIEEALQRLEQIDNAKPSEALNCLDELDKCLISDMSVECDDYDESNYCMSYEYIDFNGEGLQFYDTYKEERMMEFIRGKKISTIKNYILKLQENEKVLDALKKHLHILPMSDGSDVIAIGNPADEDVIEPNDFGYDIIKEWLRKDKSE